MEDPTGGLWIYLIFLLIPLARILPRILRKYRRKNAGLEPEPAENTTIDSSSRARECPSRQDLEKNHHKNRNQSLTRKMVGWEKTILSNKIN